MTDVESEVRAVLDAMREAGNNGDRDFIASFLSTRTDFTGIGTAPDEWYTRDQLLAIMDEAMTVGGRVVWDDVFVHVLGDVSWNAVRGRLIDFNGRERPFRSTGVLVREDGEWKGVQGHASIGIPDDQVFA